MPDGLRGPRGKPALLQDVLPELASLAGYAHDLGKASSGFQAKLHASLRGQTSPPDTIRHEWVSAYLLRELLASDLAGQPLSLEGLAQAWARLPQTPGLQDDQAFPASRRGLTCALDASLYAVASHHGGFAGNLNPQHPRGLHGLSARGHVRVQPELWARLPEFLRPAAPWESLGAEDRGHWNALLGRLQSAWQALHSAPSQPSSWEAPMLLARAALSLADHTISARPKRDFSAHGWRESAQFYANTDDALLHDVDPETSDLTPGSSDPSFGSAGPRSGFSHPCGLPDSCGSSPAPGVSKILDNPSSSGRFLKQPLAWHLDQVGDLAREFTRLFQPQAQSELAGLSPQLVAHVLGLRAKAGSPFAWQDRAVDAVRPKADEPGEKAGPAGQGEPVEEDPKQGEPKEGEPKQAEDPQVGRLILNVAATGSGKTLANLKLALAASRQDSPRIAVAFNLRSLTLQTFEAYAKFFPEGELRDEFERSFACVLGTRGGLPLKIPKIPEAQGPGFLAEDEADVCELDDDEVAGFDEDMAPAWLHALLRGLREKSRRKTLQMLASPVLISTMDWLVAAGEPGQQARHAKALLRMASSDLILDEVDSYDPAAAVAVLRVVFMGALFGRNVIVSSATLNAALATALLQTYQAGLRAGAALREDGQALPMRLHIVCDSLEPVAADNPSVEEGASLYARTMQAMARVPRPVLRCYTVQAIPKEGSAETRFAQAITQACLQLHEANVVHDARLSCRLSIGLVRVANIHRCVDVAKRLQADGRFVVCAYHSRELSLRRAWREAQLDRVLQRGTSAWLDHLLELLPWLREATGDVRLVVVATPVEEVGRDHDFDWAVIEPSSMHSIVQTAGRVNRHRRMPLAEGQVNVAVLQFNYRHLRLGSSQPAFVYPGFETATPYPSHDLARLLRGKGAAQAAETQVLDASLLFDLEERKSALARLDELSVRQTLAPALSILARQEGFESHFMLREFARNYALRDDELRIDYAVELDSSSSSRLQARTAAQEERQLPGLDLRWDEEDAPERTWLVPSRQELLQAWRWRTCRQAAGRLDPAGRPRDGFSLRVIERPVAIDWTGIEVDR